MKALLRDPRRLLVPAILFLTAMALRAPLVDEPPTTWEPLHYTIAHDLGQEDPRVTSFFEWGTVDFGPLFWNNLGFYLVTAGPAQISFEATRILMVLVSSAIAPIGYWTLRAHGVRSVYAVAAGLLLATHHTMSVWGSTISPTTTATTWLACALLFDARGRPRPAAAFLALALLSDRLVIVPAIALVVQALVNARALAGGRGWPDRLDERASLYLTAFVAGAVPLSFAGARVFSLSGLWTPTQIIGTAVLAWPLLPLILLGLAWTRTRWSSALAASQIAFLVLARHVFERSAGEGQFQAAAMLSVLAAAVAIDEADVRLSASRPVFAAATWRAGALALLILAGATTFGVLPPDLPLATSAGPGDREEALQWVRAQGTDLADAGRAAADPSFTRLVVADVPWWHVYYPFLPRPGFEHMATGLSDLPVDINLWNASIEREGTVLVLGPSGSPLNAALRATYADCSIHKNPSYEIFDGGRCIGRGERLHEEFWNRTRPAG